MGDLRKHDRMTYGGKINLMWSDESGHPFSRNGECIDISSSGLKLRLDSKLPVRSVVTVRAMEIALHGSASVRSCVRIGVKYVVGLEFLGGMKWQVPDSAAAAS
jgi:hypothetical protein